MNREDVIRMAREAGFRTGELHMQDGSGSWTFVTPIGDGCIVELERFAAIVAAAEREACAQVCEAQNETGAHKRCAAAIRARNQATKGKG